MGLLSFLKNGDINFRERNLKMLIEELVLGKEIGFGCYVQKIKRAGCEKLLYVKAGKYLLQATHETAEGICEGA